MRHFQNSVVCVASVSKKGSHSNNVLFQFAKHLNKLVFSAKHDNNSNLLVIFLSRKYSTCGKYDVM
jgi:hypothetical protein